METYLYKDLYILEDKHWWHRAKRQACLDLIATLIPKPTKILDVGCGAGKNAETFGASGIDVSPEAIRFCKKRGLKNVSRQDVYRTTFQKNSFDLITALDVIEHVDDRKALAEINRILTPEGRVLIHVPALPFLWSRWDEVLHHKRRYTKETLQKVLEAEGFTVKKITYLYSFLVLPTLIIRTLKSWFMPQQYGSDFSLSNPLVNIILEEVTKIERQIAFKVGLPFGTSLVCVAEKKA